jgi:hypothetical protein
MIKEIFLNVKDEKLQSMAADIGRIFLITEGNRRHRGTQRLKKGLIFSRGRKKT